jgi:hypothetical protein
MFTWGCWSRDEVTRVSSLDGKVDAVLFETNGGATTSFGYEVFLVKKGSRFGTKVASLYGAARNENAYGVNLRWQGNGDLSVEYFRTHNAELLKDTVQMVGRSIRISLRGGVEDPMAPPGGMLMNRQLSRARHR